MRRVLLRWSLSVLVVFVVVMPSVLAHGDGEGVPPEPDTLWVGARSVLWKEWSNFTTDLPEGEGYVQDPKRHPDRASWHWSTSMPDRWVVPAGTELRLVVTVSGLEETWPLPLPMGNRSEPFAAAFEGEAIRKGRGGTTLFATGEALVPMDPVHPPEGPIRVEIPLQVNEAIVVDTEDHFEVALHVYARGVKHNSLRIHTGGEETASHVIVPDFPVTAFRAWEDGFPHDICLWYRSQDEPCPEARLEGPVDRNGSAAETTREAVAATPWTALLALSCWCARQRLVAPYKSHFSKEAANGR